MASKAERDWLPRSSSSVPRAMHSFLSSRLTLLSPLFPVAVFRRSPTPLDEPSLREINYPSTCPCPCRVPPLPRLLPEDLLKTRRESVVLRILLATMNGSARATREIPRGGSSGHGKGSRE